MFGFSQSKPRGGGEVTRLRDGLIASLQQLQKTAPPAEADRLRTLVQRLGTSPSPTGLLRELGDLLPRVKPARTGSEIFSETATAMGAAMAAVALIDGELTTAIDRYRKGIPARINDNAAGRLARAARDLAARAEPVRARVNDARVATGELLDTLVARLSKASGAVGRVDKHTSALAKAALELNDSAGLRELKGRMEGHIDGIRVQVACLQRELAEAQVAVIAASGERKQRAPLPIDRATGAVAVQAWPEAVARALGGARDGSHLVSLVLVHVDDVDGVTARYGRPAADGMMAAIAGRLRRVARSGDVLLRISDSELALILHDTSAPDAANTGRRLAAQLARVTYTAGSDHFNASAQVTSACAAATDGPTDLLSRTLEQLAPLAEVG